MKEIRKRCACGCGGITNYGRMYVHGHHRKNKKHSKKSKLKMSLSKMGNVFGLGHKLSAEHKKKLSKAQEGNIIWLGRRHTKETKLKMSLAQIKCDPNYPYCDIWKSREYVNDLRKDHCENMDCNKIYKRLCNHHVFLDKKRCAPNEIITLCNSCHATLHHLLQDGKSPADPKDFIIINRPDHVSYVHKKTHKIIKIIKLNKEKCYAKKR